MTTIFGYLSLQFLCMCIRLLLCISFVDATSSSNEAWVSRQTLQDLYQRLLVMDLEYALDRKVEQDLYVAKLSV